MNYTKNLTTFIFQVLKKITDGKYEVYELESEILQDKIYEALNRQSRENLIEIIFHMYDHIGFHSDDITILLEDLEDHGIIYHIEDSYDEEEEEE